LIFSVPRCGAFSRSIGARSDFWIPNWRWPHRSVLAAKGILPAQVGAIGLGGIAIDQGPAVKRMAQTAHLVLHAKQRLIGVYIDDVDETPFILETAIDSYYFR
jgi:hypothetical protein